MRSKLAGSVAVGILEGVTHSASAAAHWYHETFVYFNVWDDEKAPFDCGFRPFLDVAGCDVGGGGGN